MELRRYINIVLHWWWLVAASFIVVTVAGFLFSLSQPPRYRSSLTMVVSPKSSITELSAVRQSLDSLENVSIINTYAEIIRSRRVYQQALAKLSASGGSEDVSILVNVIQRTNLIRIDAEGSDPVKVYQMANAVADQAVIYIDDLYEIYNVKVLDEALMPTASISPNIPRDTLLAAILGAIFGVSMSFLAEYLKKPLEALESFSILDRETGLYNKRYFQHRLREQINLSNRTQQGLSICLMTVQSVDGGDEAYPRLVRQRVRRQLTAYLKRHVRNGEILSRWDQQHLSWLLVDASEESTRHAIERLCKLIEQNTFDDEESGAKLNFSCNFGAAMYKQGLTDGEMVNRAELALKKAEQTNLGSYYIVPGTRPATG